MPDARNGLVLPRERRKRRKEKERKKEQTITDDG
jgi:hypothetical protein